MLFSLRRRDHEFLSFRTRMFIRIHHLAVLGLIGWVTYLFILREIL